VEQNREQMKNSSNFPFKYWRDSIVHPILGLYEICSMALERDNSNKMNPWHTGLPSALKEMTFTKLHSVPLETIKSIERSRGHVKFFTVILSAVTGGLRKFMLETQAEHQIPPHIHFIGPFPIPPKSSNQNQLSNDL
jgi:hypothetical protein